MNTVYLVVAIVAVMYIVLALLSAIMQVLEPKHGFIAALFAGYLFWYLT